MVALSTASCGANIDDHQWNISADRRSVACSRCGRECIGWNQRREVARMLSCHYDGVEFITIARVALRNVEFATVGCSAVQHATGLGEHTPRIDSQGQVYCTSCGEIASNWRKAKAGKRHGPKQEPPASKKAKPCEPQRPKPLGLAGVEVSDEADEFISYGSHGSARVRFIAQWYADHGRGCFYCGVEMRMPLTDQAINGRVPGDAPTIDHLIPISRGGPKATKWNLVVACSTCNGAKGNRMDHLTESVLGLWDRVRKAEADARAARRAEELAKREAAWLGGAPTPTFDPRLYPKPKSNCARCGERRLPYLPHFCVESGRCLGADTELLRIELSRREIAALHGENRCATEGQRKDAEWYIRTRARRAADRAVGDQRARYWNAV